MPHPFADWIGRAETQTDLLDPFSVAALAATLNAPVPGAGDIVPPLWAWLAFRPLAAMSEVGPDGHPKRGGFLPPIAQPRRMWAGSRCTFHAPIRAGDRLSRVTTITAIEEKTGAAGPMVFVTLRHALSAEGRLAMEEEQDIVYLPIPERFVAPPPQALGAVDWREARATDPVMLFRFSALTFNGHRIHYDRTYASEVEKYPGLVVHGPLQAILLFDAARRHEPRLGPARFSFRGVRPLFDHDALSLAGKARPGGLDLFTATGEGLVAMKAAIEWRA